MDKLKKIYAGITAFFDKTLIGRVVFTVLVTVITGIFLVYGYVFLRDSSMPKIMMMAAAIVWGVGGVLAFYFLTNHFIQLLPSGLKARLTPFLFVGPALVILTWYLLFPTIRSVYYSLFDDAQKEFHYTGDLHIKRGNTVIEKRKLNKQDIANIKQTLKDINFYNDYEKWLSDNYPGNIPAKYRVPMGEIPGVIPHNYFIRNLIPSLKGGFTEQQFFRGIYEIRDRFIFFGNYIKAFQSHGFLIALRNNLIWILLGPTLAVFFGLAIALLVEKSNFEVIAKALIFMPMAISFIGAGVIWKFIYAYQPPGENQIGLLNAVYTAFGGEPQNWLVNSPLNSVLLVIILVWMQTGYAMVLISSAIKGVPEDILEAARIDGAGEIRIIFSVIIPYIKGTIITVSTTIMILSLKIFDIVYSMTGGNYNTDVLATLQYREMFVYKNYNMGSTYAIILLIAVIPAVIYNLKQFKEKEAF